MKAQRALVTGGAGFIGSHLVDALLERGIEVCVLDDLSTGSPENLSAHEGDRRLTIINADVRRINAEPRLPEGIDVVFHEAAIASVPRSVAEPMAVHDVNVNAALEVMNFCLKRGVERFVFASSAAVYGAVAHPPATEDDLCLPASPYGASKLSVENYMHAYSSTYGLKTVALRYFNVYGPRQRMGAGYGGVVSLFARQLLTSVVPTVNGDGGQTRDFVYVTDVARANLLAMESSSASGLAFNVASGSQVSILGLLDALRTATRSGPVSPRFSPPREGDTRVGSASIKKARELLGYSPAVGLEEGLRTVVEHVAEQLGPVAA